MQLSPVNDLTEEEVTGYEAPFPSYIYDWASNIAFYECRFGRSAVSSLGRLKKFEKPFSSLIGLKDNLLGRPKIQGKWISKVPDAKGQNHEQFENANHFILEDIGETMADRTYQFIVKNPL